VIKKFTIALLVTIYLIVVIGVTISGHFCGGYLESYSFNVTSEEHNCCGGMPMDNNCCENVQVTIKSSADHFASDIVKIECSTSFIAITSFDAELFALQLQEVITTPVIPPPPLPVKCPVHIKNRALLI